MPAEPFEMGRLFALRVDRYGQISVRTIRYSVPVRLIRYSVPVRLIGRQVRAMLHASELVVYDDGVEVARHERLMTKAGSRLMLDRYLEALVRKPGALPGPRRVVGYLQDPQTGTAREP
ncbi:Mu transposase domain-containing protein [Streptomyces sp. NPDC096142]|uniref:Mu transposase domain-containing protein n=1 Tax=Streptomyces sp. NPDC096142 TaxID=3366077 RepID=UPI0038224AAE